MTYDLGYMSQKGAEAVKQALDGKTFMRFRVDCGIGPAGHHVTLSTGYNETDVEILTFALHCLACQ